MTVYLSGPAAPAGTRVKGGLVHRLLTPTRTACGRTPGSAWRGAPWTPPAGCCKTCAHTSATNSTETHGAQ